MNEYVCPTFPHVFRFPPLAFDFLNRFSDWPNQFMYQKMILASLEKSSDSTIAV